MKNEYFTPDIKDVYVGYELEWKCKIANQDWKKTICDTDLICIIYDEYEHADFEEPYNEQFRVPYLTKEQIESELKNDWKFNQSTSTFEKKIIKENFIFNVNVYYHNFFKKLQIKVIEEHEEFNKLNKTEYNLFSGECKDINTFRKIIKLLGI